VSLNTVTLTLDAFNGANVPVGAGTAFLTPSAAVAFPGDQFYMWPLPIEVSLVPPEGAAEDWLPAVELIACDNSGGNPSSWEWTITFQSYGAPPGFSFFLDYSNGADQYLSAQVPTVPVVTTGYQYLPLPSGTPTAGQVPAATGTGQASAWSGLIGYPGATILVAASDSSLRARRYCDYLCTGTNDDLVINEALAALGSSVGGVVLLAEGQYSEGDTGIQILAGNQHLYGLGNRAGVIISAGGSTPQMIQVGTSGTGNLANNSVRHLTLNGASGPSGCDGIVASSNMFKALDLYLASIPQDTISLSSFIATEFAYQKLIDINIYEPGRDAVVTDSNIYDINLTDVICSGLYNTSGRYGFNLAASYARLIGCRANDFANGWGLYATGAFLLQLVGCHFDENGQLVSGGGVHCDASTRVNITGCAFNSNDSYDIYLADSSNSNIVGSQFNSDTTKGPKLAGIYLSGVDGGTVADNNLVDYYLTSTRAIVAAYSENVSIHDNVVTNPNTTPAQASIRLYQSTGCTVHHNQVANGISEESGSDYNLIEHNQLTGGSIATVGTHTQVVTPPTSTSQLITFSGPISAAAMTAGGAPTTGTYRTGQTITDAYGVTWICTAGGTPGTWEPCVLNPAAIVGLQWWNYDVASTSGSGAIPATGGAVTILAVQLPYTMNLNGLEFLIDTAASGLTAGENFIGLFAASDARLAVSASCESYFETAGRVQIPFSAQAQNVPGGPTAPLIYAALMFNGGTGPTIAKGPNSSAYSGDASSAPYRWARTSATGTSMPSTLAPGSGVTSTYPFWVGVY
jgi:Periplasmic copper-binding protein (NosD)